MNTRLFFQDFLNSRLLLIGGLLLSFSLPAQVILRPHEVEESSNQGKEHSAPYRAYELGNESLLRIKAVDSEGQTFVVNIGYSDGIGPHQTSLFSNENVSVKARVQEVSRYSSLWKVTDNQLKLPFKRNDFVTFQHDTEKLWTEISRTRSKIKEFREDQTKYRWQGKDYWTGRLSFSRALSDSVSEATNSSAVRTGFQAELLYQFRLNRYFDLGIGGRIDEETLVQEDPSLEIPTSRRLAIAEITYNFETFKGQDEFIYVSAGAAIGTSETEVSGTVNTGNAMVFPFRVGYTFPFNNETALVTELVGESISATETVGDTDTEQQTTIFNSKFSIGLRF